MKLTSNQTNTPRHGSALRTAASILAATAAVTMLALSVGTAFAGENTNVSIKGFGAGINVDPSPRVEETGLPMYPGATVDRGRHRGEDGDHGDGVNLNLWFGSYGLKVVVVKLKSDDNAADVVRFYQQSLSEYGDVLDCSDGRQTREERANRAESAAERRAIAKAKRDAAVLTCGDTSLNKSSRRDGKFFKAGTKTKQYAVAVQPNGDGTSIQLLHFVKRSGDE